MSITKVGKSKTSAGATDYVFRREKNVEKQPQMIGGNVLGTTVKEIKAEFREQEKLNSKVKNTITHFSVSFPAGKIVPDEDAADFADELMRSLSYEKNPYVVVRHFDKEEKAVAPYAHIHIVASRIKNDGTLVPEWKIAEQAIEATKEIDKSYGLESIEYVKSSADEQGERNIKKNEYQMMTRTSRLSVLEEFKDCVSASLSGGRDERKSVRRFVEDIQNGGFEVLPNVSETTGRMHGFSFSKDDIIFTASRAGKPYKWANLSREINYQPETDTKFLQELKAEVAAVKEAQAKLTSPKSTPAEDLPEKVISLPKRLYAPQSITPSAGQTMDLLEQPSAKTIGESEKTTNNLEEITENEKTRQRAAIKQPIKNGNQPAGNQLDESRLDRYTPIADQSGRNGADADQTGGNGENDLADDQISRVTVNPKTIKETSNPRTQAVEVETTPRLESDAGVDEARIAGTKPAAFRHRRTDDQTAGGREEEVPSLPSRSGESQSEDGGGLENDGLIGSRISDRSQLATGQGNAIPEKPSDQNAGENRFDSEKNPGSGRSSGFERTESREKSRVDISDINAVEAVNRAADFTDNSGGFLFYDEQRLKRASGGGEEVRRTIEISINSGANRESGDRAEFQRDSGNTTENIAGNRETLQPAAGGAIEDRAGGVEANRRAAEKTAQLINIKRFSGSLDSRIVAEWTSIIEQSKAADFFNEIVKPKSQEEQRQVFAHLDRQANMIAEKLKLPDPQSETETNVNKLAAALTQIQVANYEQASGKQINDKTFEMLVEMNARRAVDPPERIERLGENFGNDEIKPEFASALEAETLDALLNQARIGFDAQTIARVQRYVETNEAAARETAALVQIAYGGQAGKLTADFKNDLIEQIYYSAPSASDTCQNFRQLDWQQTTISFAPLVSDLAERYKIEITPPDSEIERNKMLADFVAQQIVEAYESQNKPLEKYVQIQIAAGALQAGNEIVPPSQKKMIADLTERNLEPPEFSHRLEAFARNLTKYDDEKKTDLATGMADQICQEAQIKAEIHEATEMENTRRLTMR